MTSAQGVRDRPRLAEMAAPLDAEFRRLERIPLEAAMQVDLLSRIDTKLAMPLDRLLSFLQHLIGRCPEAYRLVARPTGFAFGYSTMYFDTPDLRDYRAHHNGHRRRQKFRYRRYESTGAVFFEIKQRMSSRSTTKTRVAVPTLPHAIGRPEQDLADRLALETTGLIPTLHVAYHRITLLGDDQRVTIDVGLQCEARTGRVANFGEFAILEIKDKGRNASSPIASALRSVGLRPHSVSKYCLGVATCFDGVKRNKFRPTLRQLGVSP